MERLRLALFLCLAVLAGGFTRPALAQEQAEIPVLLDGLPVLFDVQPVIQDGRTLVPFRAIAEALNVQVTWEAATQTVNATNGKTAIRLQIGSKAASRNEASIPLDVPPQILDGRTLIPLRFFSEAFACQVVWDDSLNRVGIASPPREMEVSGFYALGDSKTSSWTNLFGKLYPEHAAGNTGLVSRLALGWYSLDQDGYLLTSSRTGWQRPDGWEKVLDAAEKYSLKTEMVVHATDMDGAISSLLSSEAAMAKAVSGIMAEVQPFQGVNLDLEGLGFRDDGERLQAVRDGFTRFVRLLAEQTRAAGRELTLTLHAPNSAYRGYDYQALGELADRIIIMAYDYGSTPEPVNLVAQAVETAMASVPPEKLVLGISIPTETAESILTKVGLAKRYNLGGIALWRLGLVTTEMWDALRAAVVPKR